MISQENPERKSLSPIADLNKVTSEEVSCIRKNKGFRYIDQLLIPDLWHIIDQYLTYSHDYDITDVFCHDKKHIMYDSSTGIVATNIENLHPNSYFLSRLRMQRGASERSWAWRLYYHKKVKMDGMIGIMNVDKHKEFTRYIYSDERVAVIFAGYNGHPYIFNGREGHGKIKADTPRRFGGRLHDFIADVKLTLSAKGSGKMDVLEYYCSWSREKSECASTFEVKFEPKFGDIFRPICIFFPNTCAVIIQISENEWGQDLDEKHFHSEMPWESNQAVRKFLAK